MVIYGSDRRLPLPPRIPKRALEDLLRLLSRRAPNQVPALGAVAEIDDVLSASSGDEGHLI